MSSSVIYAQLSLIHFLVQFAFTLQTDWLKYATFIETMTIHGIITCNTCSAKDFAYYEIIQHILDSHVNRADGIFSCGDCDVAFPKKHTTLQHFIKTHLSLVYKCGACGFMSDDWMDIILHVLDHSHGRIY